VDIRNAFMDITARAKRLRPEAHIAGCLVQAMAPREAREAVVSFRRTERLGTLVMFSLGGIHLEVFKDISCRLVPLSLDDAGAMIREIHAFPLLSGLRGAKSVNFNALEDILLIMSQMAQDFPEIEEAECNPVLVSEQGAVVADIRVILSKQELKP
jgi:acetyltransferase